MSMCVCVHNLVGCAPILFYQDALTAPLSGEGGIKTQILMGKIFIQRFVEKHFKGKPTSRGKFLHIRTLVFFPPPSLVSDPLEGRRANPVTPANTPKSSLLISITALLLLVFLKYSKHLNISVFRIYAHKTHIYVH